MPGIDTNGNSRVAGPVQELIDRLRFSTEIPEQGFMARMGNPADGFDPFKLDADTYVAWLNNPSQFPGVIGARMTPVWNNALGALFVANPAIDSYGIVFVHGLMRNPWSIYARGGGLGAWHGLGGVMAFPQVVAEPADLAPLLGSLGVAASGDGDDLGSLTPDQRAAVIFMGASVMVAGKGMAMTPKWRHIDDGLRTLGTPQLTLVGGSKAILIHPADRERKIAAIQMLARATQQTGAYISGPDQNMSAENEAGDAHLFADVAKFHMVGSTHAMEMMRGRAPSNFTGDGVYEGIKVAFAHVTASKRSPLFIQGNGGVGSRVLARAIQDGAIIAGVSDAEVSKLVLAKQALEAAYKTKTTLVWDRKAARKNGKDPTELALMESQARENGFEVGDGLIESIEVANQKSGLRTAILSPNAGSHPITLKVLEAAGRLGIQAIIGGANNLMGLDEGGSYMPVAQRALKLNIFIPNDSAINRMGAAVCLFDAVGLTDDTARRLTEIVGQRVREEWFEAHRKGIPPQVYSDRLAMREWNDAVYRGEAIGGLFTEVLHGDHSPSGSTMGGKGGGGGGAGAGVASITLEDPPPSGQDAVTRTDHPRRLGHHGHAAPHARHVPSVVHTRDLVVTGGLEVVGLDVTNPVIGGVEAVLGV